MATKRDPSMSIPDVWPMKVDRQKPYIEIHIPSAITKKAPFKAVEYLSLSLSDVRVEDQTIIIAENVPAPDLKEEFQPTINQLIDNVVKNVHALLGDFMQDNVEWSFHLIPNNTGFTPLLIKAPTIDELRDKVKKSLSGTLT